MLTQSPIHHGVWWRGNYSGHLPHDNKESLDERIDRYLRDYPDAFEHPFAQVGRAWKDWLKGDARGARPQFERLARDLPTGNVARETAAWLLGLMKQDAKAPRSLRRLEFCASAAAAGPRKD